MIWLRFYTSTLDNPKVQRLPPKLFKLWVNLLCVASENDGELPQLDDLAFRIRVFEAELKRDLEELSERKLLDIDIATSVTTMHDWTEWQRKADDSGKRVRRYRNGRHPLHETGHKRDGPVSCNAPDPLHETDDTCYMKRKASVTVTAPDTDTEQIQSRAEAERHRSAPEFADAGPAEWAARMYQRHPKKRDKILAENECVRLWQKFHAPHVQAAEIEAVHALWCKTESWREKNGQFAPTLASWLRDEGYMASPEIVEKKEKNVWLESLQPSS